MKQPIFTGTWGKCHIQGIAVDEKNGYIYYSFTTKLVKATLEGEIVGSVDGLVGHLGCIAFNGDDGCVYGSLEYKNDVIGRGIRAAIASDSSFSDAFYLVRFDVSKIDRMDIPAEGSDLMTAVYLREVTDDYNGAGRDKNGAPAAHRYGCSGIDGLTFAPLPGQSGRRYLYVAYGIYSDLERDDNDHQILLCYDPDCFALARPLDQKAMHRVGPDAPKHKFFVYTGNTRYGVQNLEYDRFTNSLLMAVYRGKKPEFPNFALYAADLARAPERRTLAFGEQAETLSLKPMGVYDEKSGVYGWDFPYGSTGLYSYGDGRWLVSHNKSTPEGQCAYIYPYVWDGEHPLRCTLPAEE